MERARTRGQPAAVAAIRRMVTGAAPHALLLVGPPGIGKTTLALDLAAGLLCTAPDPGDRPCRECRACRMVEHANHPDLHRLVPGGSGNQITIGAVRDLIRDLALLPVEGGARVAVVESVDRMNEDAQSALLKTLEEPPAGVTIVLCADEEERLLATVRSRCVRVRLGPVGPRDIEAVLGEHGVAEAPVAARMARLSGGRPGHALALARAPEALGIRGELARSLLDLAAERPSTRLARIRDLVARAGDLAAAVDAAAGTATPGGADAAVPARGGRRARASSRATREPAPAVSDAGDEPASGGDEEEPARKVAPSERRRAAATLLGIWSDVARDLALVGAGVETGVRDVGVLDDLRAAAGEVDPAGLLAFTERLARTGELLEANVAPELLLDALVLAWPQRRHAA